MWVKGMFKKGLKLKMRALIILCALVPMVILGFSAYNKGQQALNVASSNTLYEMGNLTKINIDKAVENTVAIMKLASQAQVFREGNNDKIKAYMDRIKADTGLFETIVWVESNGTVKVDTEGNAGIDLSQRSYIIEAQQGKTAISDVIFSKGTGNAIVAIAIPVIEDGGNFHGIVVGTLLWESIRNEVEKKTLGETGEMYLVNNEGLMLSNSRLEGETLLTKKIDTQAIQDLAAGKEGVKIYKDYQGIDVVGAYFPLKENGWGIIAEQNVEEAFAAVISLRNRIVIDILIVGIVATLIAIYFSSKIVNPIVRLADVSENISKGDLSVDINIEAKDEVGVLVNSYKHMVEGLRKLVINIQDNSQTLAASTQEMSASIQQISTVTQDQANQVQQVTYTIEQMAGAIEQVANSAENAANLAQEADGTARQGGVLITNVVGGMNEINENMEKLSLNSEKIGEILVVIDDIADQTNLLALNAAIESARAGEHGKGFAVVAEEVRKLAERSGKATKEIDQLIATIRKDTITAVEAANKGGTMTQEAGQAFTVISNLVSRTADMVNEIASASEELSSSSGEVVNAAEGIAGVEEEFAAEGEEIAASAEELAAMAQNLEAMVEGFRVS